MKKPLFWIGLLLVVGMSCEDPMEGDVVPFHTSAENLVSDPYTHYRFAEDTEGKADGSYHVGTNPESGSEIYMEIANGIAVDAWASQLVVLAMEVNTTPATHSSGLTNPTDPVPGKPLLVTLGQINQDPGYCDYLYYTSDPQTQETKGIIVKQPSWKPGLTRSGRGGTSVGKPGEALPVMQSEQCVPTAGEVLVFVPRSL